MPARVRVRVTGGDNAVLVEDPGQLASLDARTTSRGEWIAPPSRIAADLRLLESRGDAAARLFLDLWGEQVL